MLEPILSVTYGCILYQEQVIEIFRKLAGYSLGQADMVRRAMSKKKVKDIEKERGAFLHGDPARGIAGCEANGIPVKVAEDIYNEMYDLCQITPLTRPIRSAMRSSRIRRRGSNITIRRNIWRH